MSRSIKARGDPKNFRGRLFTRVLDLRAENFIFPFCWWPSRSAIEGWAVVHGIRIDRPFRIKRNLINRTVTISQRQGAPAARIYVAHKVKSPLPGKGAGDRWLITEGHDHSEPQFPPPLPVTVLVKVESTPQKAWGKYRVSTAGRVNRNLRELTLS